MSDEMAKMLALVAAPTLAAIVAGTALLIQNFMTDAREAKARAASAQEERDRENRTRQDADRRELATARTEWAAAAQEALVAMLIAIAEWKKARLESNNPAPVIEAVKASLGARTRAQVATAKLLTVELDQSMRSSAVTLTNSLDVDLDLKADPNAVAATAQQRMLSLMSALNALTARMAGIAEDDTEVVRNLIAGSNVSPANKAAYMKQLDERPQKWPASGASDGAATSPL